MFETVFKRIDDILRQDPGCSTALDYVEQTSWILFLKYLDDRENEKVGEAELDGKMYNKVLSTEYQWSTWAIPKNNDGSVNHNKMLTGDDLIVFVNNELLPYLAGLKNTNSRMDSIEYKIGEIFSEIKNKISSGYNLREVINEIDNLQFKTSQQKHEISTLYESGLAQMGNAGRNGGEYYTPRPLIRTIIKVINPRVGETVYDGAVGSAGFLVEAFEYMKEQQGISLQDREILQTRTFYGKEKKGLAFISGVMNMILHGIDAPNIVKGNTLEEKVADYEEKDRVDVIITNPPFGGTENKDIKNNFLIGNSSETAFLFLQHFIKKLKKSGRAGIVIKNTFLSNRDAKQLRDWVLGECKVEAILDLPPKVFSGAGVKTIVLFLKKGESTKRIWYYELNLERNLGKTDPLVDEDLSDFVKLYKTKSDSVNSWSIDITDLDEDTTDLSVRNPNKKSVDANRDPKDIIQEIEKNNKEIVYRLDNIKKMI